MSNERTLRRYEIMNNTLTVSKERAGEDTREMIFATCVSDVASNAVFHDEVKAIELSARDYPYIRT